MEFCKTLKRVFHDIEYALKIEGNGSDAITIEVEESDAHKKWRSSFSVNFIEEITRRTGNFKTFQVFVKMLVSALEEKNDAVHLDLLTSRDLDMLRQRADPKASENKPPGTAKNANPGNNKRYLILTYQAEFDKVHYPLALAADESINDPEVMAGMINKLKQELNVLKGTIETDRANAAHNNQNNVSAFQQDGAFLQQQNMNLNGNLNGRPNSSSSSASVAPNLTGDQHNRNNYNLYESHREKRLEAERDEITSRAEALEQENEKLRELLNTGGAASSSNSAEVRVLKQNLQKSQNEVKQLQANRQKALVEHRKEMDVVKRELTYSKNQMRRLQNSIKRLESDNDNLKKRAGNLGPGVYSRLPRPSYQGASPGGNRGASPARGTSRERAGSNNSVRSRAPSVTSQGSRDGSTGPAVSRYNRVGSRPVSAQNSNASRPGSAGSRAGSIGARNSRLNNNADNLSNYSGTSRRSGSRGVVQENLRSTHQNPFPTRTRGVHTTTPGSNNLPPGLRQNGSRSRGNSPANSRSGTKEFLPMNIQSQSPSKRGFSPSNKRGWNNGGATSPSHVYSPSRGGANNGRSNSRPNSAGRMRPDVNDNGNGFGARGAFSKNNYPSNRDVSPSTYNRKGNFISVQGNQPQFNNREGSISPSNYRRNPSNNAARSREQSPYAQRLVTNDNNGGVNSTRNSHEEIRVPGILEKPVATRSSPRGEAILQGELRVSNGNGSGDIDQRLNALQHFLRSNKT